MDEHKEERRENCHIGKLCGCCISICIPGIILGWLLGLLLSNQEDLQQNHVNVSECGQPMMLFIGASLIVYLGMIQILAARLGCYRCHPRFEKLHMSLGLFFWLLQLFLIVRGIQILNASTMYVDPRCLNNTEMRPDEISKHVWCMPCNHNDNKSQWQILASGTFGLALLVPFGIFGSDLLFKIFNCLRSRRNQNDLNVPFLSIV
jgi:hypothetical protein